MLRTNHKPRKGIYKLPKDSKYKGSHDPVYRSSWELQMCKWCDTNPNVKYWMSEGTVIPYVSKVDRKLHRYYIDFTVQFTNGQTVLFEIKPHRQTLKPTHKKIKTKKHLNEVYTYTRNVSKWEAAKEFAKKHDVSFQILTENELKKMGMKIPY